MCLAQVTHSNLKWKIAGGLILILALAATAIWLDTDQQRASTLVPKIPVTTPNPIQVESPIHTDLLPAEVTQISAAYQAEALVQDSILKDELPDPSSLSKEQIAELDDIQDQLLTQKKQLEAQQAHAEQLIQRKQAQIKILEQQLLAQQ